MNMVPIAEDQVRFLLILQRLLNEGQFAATYKFALLMALADLSVELGDGSGEALTLSAYQIAEKFVEYYWRQSMPFLGRSTLRQNAGNPPIVVTLLQRARESQGENLAEAKRDGAAWKALTNGVAQTIRSLQLRYLQNVGRASLAFLYDQPDAKAPSKIVLYPGVAYCFRRFHALVNELVQGAWTRWVRERNLSVIGDVADLHEFLFGAERASLALVRAPLQDLQRGLCFYCGLTMRGQPHVDHFNPWALYQLDLATISYYHMLSATLPSGSAWHRRTIWQHGRTETDCMGIRLVNSFLAWGYSTICPPHHASLDGHTTRCLKPED